jgi:hypothetical protein
VEPELRVETLRRKSNTKGFAISQALAQFNFKRGRTKAKLGNLAGTLESVNLQNSRFCEYWEQCGIELLFGVFLLQLFVVKET